MPRTNKASKQERTGGECDKRIGNVFLRWMTFQLLECSCLFLADWREVVATFSPSVNAEEEAVTAGIGYMHSAVDLVDSCKKGGFLACSCSLAQTVQLQYIIFNRTIILQRCLAGNKLVYLNSS